jgi:Tol biopolymer transport system component
MLFWAFTFFALLIGVAVCFLAFLFRASDQIELVSEITPSPSGDEVVFVAYHGELDDSWASVRDFIVRHTGYVNYPESVRLMLLSTSSGKLRDLGAGEPAGECIAWRSDESLIAYVSGEFQPNDERKRLQLYDVSNESSETAFVGSDWYIQTLRFSPNGKSLAFVENYNARNLTIIDVIARTKVVLASGVTAHDLCWSKDGSTIFCVRNGREIWQVGFDARSSKRIFRGKDMDENYPHRLVLSPDGSKIGFCYSSGFHVLELATAKVEKWFDCRHYFLTFDWRNSGICYLDAVGDETKRKARVMVYDPNTKSASEVAIGRYAHVAWLRDGVLILRKENTELWELNIKSKATKRILPLNDE